MKQQASSGSKLVALKPWWLAGAAGVLLLAAVAGGVWVVAASPWQGSGAARQEEGGAFGASYGLSDGPAGRPAAPSPSPAPPSFLDSSASSSGKGSQGVTLTTAPVPAPTSGGALDIAQRQIIAQASLFLEVASVQAAVAQVQAAAESLGGFVEQLVSSGGPERQQSTMTVRVPQGDFFTAMDRIRALGTVKAENLGSQDVTEQFIDLEARLRSLQREEESLLSLLGKAQQVSEILTIERELARVRMDLERYQGQLNYLKRRVDLASIKVSLSLPEEKPAQPPVGYLMVQVPDAAASAQEAKALVARLGGEVDNLSISVKGGKTRADIALRVFAKDFDQAVSSLEGQGEVLSKEVREGTPAKGDAKPAEKPDAPITVSFLEPEETLRDRLVSIAWWVGGAALVVLAAYLAYRMGRRRGSRQVAS